MSRNYRIADPDELVFHDLDGMMAVYQRASGITHLVSEPVPAIIEAMGEQIMDTDAVVLALSQHFDLENGADAANIVLARLEDLCGLGLVERVLPDDG